MGYFQDKYNSRVVIYDRRAFIRLTTVIICRPVSETYLATFFHLFLFTKLQQIFK